MDSKERILRNVKRDKYISYIITNLDDDLIQDVKDALKEEELIVDILPEELEMLTQIINEIKNMSKDKWKPISSHIYESYLSLLIYKELALKGEDIKEPFNKIISKEEILKASANKEKCLDFYLEFLKGQDFPTDSLGFRMCFNQLYRVLENRKININFFGLENINDSECIEIQEKINIIVAWRGPQYSTNLYTKSKNIATYSDGCNHRIDFGHDYERMTYNQKEKPVLLEKKLK